MFDARTLHLNGIPDLIDPAEKPRAARQLASAKGRRKWLDRLAHNIGPHPGFASRPPRGARSEIDIYRSLIERGATEECYVVASDSELDDSFQPLERMVMESGWLFEHGTILSCLPGQLAMFRTAPPSESLIVDRSSSGGEGGVGRS